MSMSAGTGDRTCSLRAATTVAIERRRNRRRVNFLLLTTPGSDSGERLKLRWFLVEPPSSSGRLHRDPVHVSCARRGVGGGRGGGSGGSGRGSLFEQLWTRRKFDVLGKKVLPAAARPSFRSPPEPLSPPPPPPPPPPFPLRSASPPSLPPPQRGRGEQPKRVGHARADALDKRKATLLPEFRQRGTGNAFVDRRFGESDASLGEEDKAVLRFQCERQAQFSRRSKFALGDDDDDGNGGGRGREDVLTHGGAALAHLDDFREDVPGNSDDDGDDAANIDVLATRELNFGGGVAKSGPAASADGGDERAESTQHPKTRREVMEEVIAKSKLHRALRAREKEADEGSVRALDDEFRMLAGSGALAGLARPRKGAPAVAAAEAAGVDDGQAEVQQDNYDRLAREMGLEMRARAGERLRTPEEVAREEREKLLELEKRQQKRMAGDASSSGEEDEDEADAGTASTSRQQRFASGDDPGENFELEGSKSEDHGATGWATDVLAGRGGADEDGSDGQDSDSDDANEEEGGSDHGSEEDVGEDEEGSSGDSPAAEEDESAHEEGRRRKTNGSAAAHCLAGPDWEQDSDEGGAEEGGAAASSSGLSGSRDERGRRGSHAGASTSGGAQPIAPPLPYVIDVPMTLEALQTLVAGRPAAELAVAVQRIRACNAISLAAGNRLKMQAFYNILLQYFSSSAGEVPLPIAHLDILAAALIGMSSDMPAMAALCARQRILRMQHQLSAKLRANDGSSTWPPPRVLLLLRLWSLVFPPSDFLHPVMTPAALLAGQYLARCPVTSAKDAAVGLFFTALVASMTEQSRRYFPEAISFLHALLITALPAEQAAELELGGVQHLRAQVGGGPWLRTLRDELAAAISTPLSFHRCMATEPDDPFFTSSTFRLGALQALLVTLWNFASRLVTLASYCEIFGPFVPIMEALLKVSCESQHRPSAQAPGPTLHHLLDEVTGLIRSNSEQQESLRQPLRIRAKRAVPIKQFNPRFEEGDYDPDKERSDRKKLQRQLKKEARGAARELRKDNHFLAAEKDQEKRAAEDERSEKYRRAMAFLQEQEAQYRSGQLGGGGRKRRRSKR
eukprot:SM000083S22759  [mRNA]  locus=s83:296346:303039:- [translate_table: standard]